MEPKLAFRCLNLGFRQLSTFEVCTQIIYLLSLSLVNQLFRRECEKEDAIYLWMERKQGSEVFGWQSEGVGFESALISKDV